MPSSKPAQVAQFQTVLDLRVGSSLLNLEHAEAET